MIGLLVAALAVGCDGSPQKNRPPAADDGAVSTLEDTPASITLSGSDVDGDLLTYSIVTGPAHGGLTGTPPGLMYAPDPDYNGADGFTFLVNDGELDSAEATVSITVTALNDPPVAGHQSVTAAEDTPLSVTLTGFDVDGDELTYAIVDNPSHGELSGDRPELTYTPDPDYDLTDGFTFKVNDGLVDSAPATVTITVTAANDAPTADDQSVSTDEGVAIAIALGGSDTDDDPLTFVIATDPTNGALSGLVPATGVVTYDPEPGHIGPDSFQFVVNDGTVDSAKATVSIIVGGVAFLHPVDWALPSQRWQDIADNDYDFNQVSSYLYPDGAVTVYYDAVAPTLVGTLIGLDLKPNFAYQIKLNGKPTYWFPADGDDWANEQLGYAGRWWVKQVDQSSGDVVGEWNSNDGEYDYWKGKLFTDGTYDYVFEGYLLFDYIVTDEAGFVIKSLALDSSLHVLYKPIQRPPVEAEDTTPTSHTVIAESASDWYDQDYGESIVEIYAQWESGRALPGTLLLPEGTYNVRMFLTEESFHDGVSGWATVMACDDLLFTVAP